MRKRSPSSGIWARVIPSQATLPLACTPPMVSKVGNTPSTPEVRVVLARLPLSTEFLGALHGKVAAQIRHQQSVDEKGHHHRRPSAGRDLDQRPARLHEADAKKKP